MKMAVTTEMKTKEIVESRERKSVSAKAKRRSVLLIARETNTHKTLELKAKTGKI
jgi:hypothetical protein